MGRNVVGWLAYWLGPGWVWIVIWPGVGHLFCRDGCDEEYVADRAGWRSLYWGRRCRWTGSSSVEYCLLCSRDVCTVGCRHAALCYFCAVVDYLEIQSSRWSTRAVGRKSGKCPLRSRQNLPAGGLVGECRVAGVSEVVGTFFWGRFGRECSLSARDPGGGGVTGRRNSR